MEPAFNETSRTRLKRAYAIFRGQLLKDILRKLFSFIFSTYANNPTAENRPRATDLQGESPTRSPLKHHECKYMKQSWRTADKSRPCRINGSYWAHRCRLGMFIFCYPIRKFTVSEVLLKRHL